MEPRQEDREQTVDEEGSSASWQGMTFSQRGEWLGERRKDERAPYKLAGSGSAAYRGTLKKFLREDSRKLREETTKRAWALVL